MDRLRPLWQLIINLYIAQALFISLTPLVLFSAGLAAVWPALFVAAQALLGWHGAAKIKKKPFLSALIAGTAAQLPGIVSALIILKGIASGYTTPDAFDFTIQIWYSSFAPLSAMLPRVQYGYVPLYFVVTIVLPFIIALVPACGTLFQRKQANSGIDS